MHRGPLRLKHAHAAACSSVAAWLLGCGASLAPPPRAAEPVVEERVASAPLTEGEVSDADLDRIADDVDQCPDEPETYNGTIDEDGCPDRCTLPMLREEVVILEVVNFEAESFAIPPSAMPMLEAIARTLADHPEITRLHVVGHADARERRAPGLSLRRADAVRDALHGLGVASERLSTEGRGAAEVSGATRLDLRFVGFEIVRDQSAPTEVRATLPP